MKEIYSLKENKNLYVILDEFRFSFPLKNIFRINLKLLYWMLNLQFVRITMIKVDNWIIFNLKNIKGLIWLDYVIMTKYFKFSDIMEYMFLKQPM